MFRLKREHVAAVAAPFRARVEADVGARYLDATRARRVDAATARRHVGWLLDRALAAGLRTHRSLALHAVLAARFGPFFDEKAPVAEFLARAGADVDAAFPGVVDAVPPTTWTPAPDAAWQRDWDRALAGADGGGAPGEDPFFGE